MGDYRSSADSQKGLMEALAGVRQANQFQQEKGLKQLLEDQKIKAEQQKQQLDFENQSTAQDRAVSETERLQKENPGMGVVVSKEGAEIKPNPILATIDAKKQQFDQKQANLYSKGLEKYSDLTGAAKDLETITNRDGQGGVFTNPNAQLVSGGKMMSAMPDSALGLGEMLKLAAPGTAEERKALARYKLAMGHALTGARMNPAMQKAIQDSLGGMASGDPALMAKGLRGSARVIGGTVKTVQGGFSPEVRGMVHDQMGGDPMELFGSIPSEAGPPSNLISPPPGSAKQVAPKPTMPQQAPQQAPAAPTGAPSVPSFEEFKKMKASGQIR